MIYSDSLPIQFWPFESETHNEKEICGQTAPKCFSLNFLCTQTSLIQLSDIVAGDYHVFIINSATEIILYELVTVTDIFSYVLDFEVLCGETNVQVLILSGSEDDSIDSTFTSDLDGWVNDGSASLPWIYTSAFSNSATVLLQSSDVISDNLEYTVALSAGYYTFERSVAFRRFTDPSVLASGTITFQFMSGGDVIAEYEITANTTFPTDIELTEESNILLESPADSVRIFATRVSTLYNIRFYIKEVFLTFLGSPILKSDPINVVETLDCSVTIDYTNSSDFDGIVYETSPQPEFTINIPAIFFEEDNPQEVEDLELSNDEIVTLRQSITEKRLLDTGFLPNYMHKKIQKILMHETITIDGDQWKRRDAYETSPIKDYGLKRAQVWLTKYNSIDRNII